MGIGCDHLLSGRGRRDFALLRYLVLLNQLKHLCQLLAGCAWPTSKLYADHRDISSLDAVDFSGKTSELSVRRRGAGAAWAKAHVEERGDRAPRRRGKGRVNSPGV